MMKKLWMTGIFACIVTGLFAQNEEINHQKYWWLRKRLKETFLHVGDKPGESIPGSRLYVHYQTKKTIMDFGDCTIHLGWYLSVLATENFLLTMYGKDTKDNETELYYALKAFERLDKVSNVLWTYYNGQSMDAGEQDWEDAQYDPVQEAWVPKYLVSTEPDGFFLREDIPPGFQHKLKGVDMVDGTTRYYDPWTPTNYYTRGYRGNEESKDQLISMLMGLSFVNHFTKPWATVNGVNLRAYAHTLAKRMMDYVRYQSHNHEYAWKITNPQRGYELVHRGNNPSLMSYGLAWGANKLVYGKNFSGVPIAQGFMDIAPNNNYVDPNAILFKSVFILPRGVPVILDVNFDFHINYYMYFVLASISNTWRDPWPIGHNGVGYLKKRCADNEEKGWLIYPMMNYAFYPGKTLPYPKEAVEAELGIFPCEGSYNFFNTEGVSSTWSPRWFSSNRFQSSNGHYEGVAAVDCNNYFNGRFNGLDYMLFYNLYRIIYVEQLSYHNYESPNDLWISHVYPVSPGGDGSMTDPLRIYSLYSIHSSSVANAVSGSAPQTADVEYVAGSNIRLLPGFKVNYGAHFKGYISQGGQCDALGMKRTAMPGNHPATGRIVQWRDSLMKAQLHADMEEFKAQPPQTTASIRVYPNPTSGEFSVVSSEIFDLLVLIDASGSQVMSKSVNMQPNMPYTTDISQLAPGSYFLFLYHNEQLVGHQTLIKQ